MTNTITYEIYKHASPTSCSEGPLSYRKDRGGHRDECFMCDTELEQVDTEVISTELVDPDDSVIEQCERCSDYERAVFLGMNMESLRGNWSQVTERCAIVGAICDMGVGDELSDEFLESARSKAVTLTVRKRATGQYPDGRMFRGQTDGCYGKLWDEVDKDPQIMRRFATYIPHDMTFDKHYFDRLDE